MIIYAKVTVRGIKLNQETVDILGCAAVLVYHIFIMLVYIHLRKLLKKPMRLLTSVVVSSWFQDGTADMLELYNCMDAEEILYGKTHDNYAIFFQVILHYISSV